jgi:hypothetical protein
LKTGKKTLLHQATKQRSATSTAEDISPHQLIFFKLSIWPVFGVFFLPLSLHAKLSREGGMYQFYKIFYLTGPGIKS